MSHQTTTRRRRTSPLDDDDLLVEILLRVPPQPSSLPRASLVCKRWRRLVSDPWFLRRLSAHHRKPPPLVGFFERIRIDVNDFVFNPILEPPDRIPPQRFSLSRFRAGMGWRDVRLLDCRHGRILILDKTGNNKVFIVCDPITGVHVQLVIPPEFTVANGAVLCAAGDKQGHVHGACHWSPFKVVLVAWSKKDHLHTMVCVYSSETSLWENIIGHGGPGKIIVDCRYSSTLIAHALYWNIVTTTSGSNEEEVHHWTRGILKFDLDRQTLTVMRPPIERFDGNSRIIKATDGGVGFATLSYKTLHLRVWHWNVNNGRDAAKWVLVKTVNLHNVFGLERLPVSGRRCFVLGYDADDSVLFIRVDSSLLIMLQLDSMQFKRHYVRTDRDVRTDREDAGICYPFRSFYPAGAATPVTSDGD